MTRIQCHSLTYVGSGLITDQACHWQLQVPGPVSLIPSSLTRLGDSESNKARVRDLSEDSLRDVTVVTQGGWHANAAAPGDHNHCHQPE